MANGRSILLRLTGDPADAKRAIGEVTERLTAFARQKAQATLDVATQQAQQKVDEVQDAVRRFDATQATARLDIREAAVRQQIEAVRERLERLGQQEASPKVTLASARAVEQLDRLEVKLAKIGRERINVRVDVDRDLSRGISGTFTAALEQLPRMAGNAIGGITSLGGAIASLGPFVTGAAILIGAVLAPALLLLATSLANAIIGAGALAIALGGLAGPVVLVAVAALTRFAAILGALKEHQNQSSQQGAAVAASQDQIRGATDALAGAQQNLREQTTAAYQAWQDSIEAVKDDLLSVQQAQLGIDDAQLSLREAQAALRNLRHESGTTGNSLDGLFRKFTDVNINFDTSAFQKALAGATGGMSDADELRLERAILNVRQARLREKQAVDQLHDAHTKLRRDRQTEQDFAERGIRAYRPYLQAVQGVATAQRQLASAQRASNQALERQSKLWDDLTPAEQRFARRLEHFQDNFRRAFGPATRNLLRGFGTLLDAIGDSLNRPGIRASLAILGASIGSMLRGIAREIRRPEFQEGFERFTRSAARLIRTVGSDAIRAFLRLMLRIANEALPPLERGLKRVVGWLDTFVDKVSEANTTSNRGFGRADDFRTESPLERFIRRAIGSFKTWIGIIRDLGRVLGGFFRAMLPDGDKLADDFGRIVRNFADWVNSKGGQKSIRDFFHDVRTLVREIAHRLDQAAAAADKLSKLRINIPNRLDKLTDLLQGNPLLRLLTRQAGGIVPGSGRGDIVPAMLEPGEFVIRRAAVSAFGSSFFAALNGGLGFQAGGIVPAVAGGGGGPRVQVLGGINIQAPAGSSPDGVTAAVQLARVLEQRGG